MQKVLIVGCPGAGKSTFARKLAEKTGLPLIHLDYYYHQKEYDYHHDRAAWMGQVKKLLKQKRWIMDGNYSSTYEQRFDAADTIIFFDFSRWQSLLGVLQRRFLGRGAIRSDMPPDWEESINLDFLKLVWKFNGDSRAKIEASFRAARGKQTLRFKSRREANAWLDSL